MSENTEDKKDVPNEISLDEIKEETDQELLNKLQSSEIDIDEFVTRSIRKAQKTGVDEGTLNSTNESTFADVYTVNSKVLPSLTENFQPHISQEIEIPDFTLLIPATAVE